MSLVIAGERSGVGKTTITLALLSYLRRCGLPVQSFKVGPDYIDPMFHQYVTGLPCRNLDPVLTSEAYIQQCFARHTQTGTHALVEGVMGLFDGAAPAIALAKQAQNVNPEQGNPQSEFADFASTAHIARLLDLPILLVVDCSRLSASVAALVHGYCSFDPRLRFAGLVLNRVGSDRHLAMLQSALTTIDLPILGVFYRHDAITIPDRHLGLVPTAELDHLPPLMDQLARLGETSFNWTTLLPLLAVEPLSPIPPLPIPPSPHPSPLRLAIAHDSAFSFYYADNLDLLTELGAELVPWSPLADPRLPERVQGLYLGGGFPEMFAAQLAHNETARISVQRAIQAGIPTYAECGGLMYLCQEITDFEGRSHPMVGVLPGTATMGKKLTLGYRRAVALQDGLMLPRGAIAWGHEFHRSQLPQTAPTPVYGIGPDPSGAPQMPPNALEGWHLPNLHASYVHLHWGAAREIPERFLQACLRFKAKG